MDEVVAMKTVVMFALSVSTLVAQPQLVVASHAGAAEDCILTPTAACILVLAKPMNWLAAGMK